MKELHTEIEINAAPGVVWQILTDLPRWTEWNPLIAPAVGKAELGARVDITTPPSGPGKMVLHCRVIRFEAERELCWQYHVLLPFLFAGEHSFTLEPLGAGRVRLIDREVFRGLLLPLQARQIDGAVRMGFEAADRALKARAEQFGR